MWEQTTKAGVCGYCTLRYMYKTTVCSCFSISVARPLNLLAVHRCCQSFRLSLLLPTEGLHRTRDLSGMEGLGIRVTCHRQSVLTPRKHHSENFSFFGSHLMLESFLSFGCSFVGHVANFRK